ncbi:MAG: hypothetical protein P1U36_10605 [Legionellaceae bacterium]|nr:hypothetical protein [Legionellaceae bacterium]
MPVSPYSFWQFHVKDLGLNDYTAQIDFRSRIETRSEDRVLVDLAREDVLIKSMPIPSISNLSDTKRKEALDPLFTDLLAPLEGQAEKHKAMLDFCKTRLHQNGLLCILPSVMKYQAELAGGAVKMGDRETGITLKNQSLYIHQTQVCNKFTYFSNIDSPFIAEDDAYLIRSELLFKVSVNGGHQIQVDVLDVVVDCQDSRIAHCFDQRSLLQKVIDFFKAIFGLNVFDATQRIEDDAQLGPGCRT